MTISNRKVVVGLGKTGLACVRYLHRQGCQLAVTDSRDHPPGLETLQTEYPDVPVAVGGFSETLIEHADELIVSPGVSLKHPLIAKQIARGVPAIGDIELFAREVDRPVIAITGSNGKTTVTTLVGLMFQAAGYRAAVCGNIGEPVLDLLLDVSQPDFYVMELSSFQLETTYSLEPKIAVILNVSPDHMDRYQHFQAYLCAKQRIYQHCHKAIVNADAPEIWQGLTEWLKFDFSFTLKPPDHDNQFGVIQDSNQYFLAFGQKRLLSTDCLKLKGGHHFQNALAALAIGYAGGLSLENMITVLQNFSGLAHRCQWVAEKSGVSWYNDSKATNAGATIAAIQSVAMNHPGNIILIAGGDANNHKIS